MENLEIPFLITCTPCEIDFFPTTMIADEITDSNKRHLITLDYVHPRPRD